jgi:LPS-assembly protein
MMHPCARAHRSFWQSLAAFGLSLCLSLGAVQAQDRAVFIADRMVIAETGQLLAEGSFEARYRNLRVTSDRMRYDRSTDTIVLEGAIVLDDGVGSVYMADFAQLSDDLQTGMLQSARVIVAQQLQLTASQVQRVDGRFTDLQNVAASSCKICTTSAVPLWEIRARRVVHDTQARQIYFEGAQFRFGGVPLAYLPSLRIPDPTLKRATGFLPPRFETNSALGFGVRLPYFIELGPSRDVTLTPYLSVKDAQSLNLRYRQAYGAGTAEVNAAITRDQETGAALRGYLLARGTFFLPQDYSLALRAETVSDAAYFRGYGLEERDRLVTSITIDRTSRDQYDLARLQGFNSIRSDDVNATQPSVMADFNRQTRIDLGAIGMVGLSYHGHARLRASQSSIDGVDPDDFADGRDVTGFGLRADWHNSAITPQGFVLGGAVSARADSYGVREDADYAGQYTRTHLAVAGDIRYPMIKSGANGAQHLIEPMAQFILAPNTPTRLFNEDSALVEFDEGNLFALNRFPGSDRIEAGARVNFGLRYGYSDASGNTGQFVLGKVISTLEAQQFSSASGLGQKSSDWLVAGQMDMNGGFGVTLRTWLQPNSAQLRKMEFRSTMTGKDSGLSLGYLYAPADTDEARTDTIREVSLNARQNLSEQLSADLTGRYDAQSDKVSRAGMGLAWRNECLTVDISLSRTFTSSVNVEPTTDFGLSIAFTGIGGKSAGPAGQCSG